MPYSIDLIAKDKAEAVAECARQIDAIVAAQPAHQRDKPFILAGVTSFLGMLQNDSATEELVIVVNGSIKETETGIAYTSFHVSGYVQALPIDDLTGLPETK